MRDAQRAHAAYRPRERDEKGGGVRPEVGQRRAAGGAVAARDLGPAVEDHLVGLDAGVWRKDVAAGEVERGAGVALEGASGAAVTAAQSQFAVLDFDCAVVDEVHAD